MRERYRHRLTMRAYSGDREPLAKYLEAGGDLLPCMRQFVVGYLRGEPKFRPGNRRTFAQKQSDREVGEEVGVYRELLGLKLSEAKRKYLDLHRSVNPDTLDSILKRYVRDQSDAKERMERRLQEQRRPQIDAR